jgi:hypothetical protein
MELLIFVFHAQGGCIGQSSTKLVFKLLTTILIYSGVTISLWMTDEGFGAKQQ